MKGRWRRWRWLLLAGAVLGLGVVWWGTAPALQAVGGFLILDEAAARADCIIVHAGGTSRLATGVRLFREGWADQLLVFFDDPYDQGIYGLRGVDAIALTVEYLHEQGVPPEALTTQSGVRSSYDEVIQARAYLTERGFQSALVVTNPYHTRRLRYAYRSIAGVRQDLRFTPVPSAEALIEPKRWWTRERDLVWVHSEYLKLLLYWWKY